MAQLETILLERAHKILKEKSMGGLNQGTLEKDKPETPKSGQVLSADALETLDMAEMANKGKKRKTDKSKKKPKQPKPKKTQTQNLRQHVELGECHWHDDANGLKAAIPVADWNGMTRRLRQMETVKYADLANKSHITFRPFIEDGELQVATNLKGITISGRFDQLINLKPQGK